MLRRALPIYAALAILFCWPLFSVPGGFGIMDWDQHFFLYAAVAKSVLAFHQLPFWNPWYCGGNMLWQNPEVAVLSPAYLLALVMPLPVAMKINIALHFVAGLAGMHLLLTRRLGLTSWPLVTFLASVFALSGGFAMHVGVGHATFLTFMYLPFVLYFVTGACAADEWRQGVRPALAAGGFMALSAWNGGIYPLVMNGVALIVFAMSASVIRRTWRPLAFVALSGLAGIAYAAPKLLPIAAAFTDPTLVDSRADLREPDWVTWGEMKDALVNPNRPADWIGWFEYGNYVGPLAALLFLGAFAYWLSTRPARDRWLGISLTLAAIVLLLLARGTFSQFAPYTLLRELPVFSSLRKPGRYSLIFVLFAAAATAEALRSALKGYTLPPGLRRIAGVVLIIATADVVWHNRAELAGTMSEPPASLNMRLTERDPAPTIDTTSKGDGSNTAMVQGITDNRDIVECHLLIGPPRAINASQPIVWSDRNAQLSRITYSPNRIAVDVSTSDAARVFLNQNYMKGWHASNGRLSVDPATGLANATLPAGFQGTLTFTYTPPLFWIGLVTMLGALAATGAAKKFGS